MRYNCSVDSYEYLPPQRSGIIFLGALLSVITAAFLWQVWQSARSPLTQQLSQHGPWALLFGVLMLGLGYAFRALQGAFYLLSRDGLVIHWGLREVAISTYDILWIAPLADLPAPPPSPLVRLPGAWLGRAWRRDPQHGQVEYLAAQRKGALFIATAQGAFVISPQSPQDFLKTFSALNELGSVSPLPTRDIHPGDWLGQAWHARPTRILWLSTLTAVIAVWLLAFWGMGRTTQVSLGFTAGILPRPPIPSGSLVLFPILGTFFALVDWASGQFLYRRDTALAYFFWSIALLTNLGLLGAGLLLLSRAL